MKNGMNAPPTILMINKLAAFLTKLLGIFTTDKAKIVGKLIDMKKKDNQRTITAGKSCTNCNTTIIPALIKE